MFLAFFLSFGIIGKILLVASIVFYIYRHITRTVVKVFFDLEELRIKMISGAWYTIPYLQMKEYYSVRMTQGFTKELFFTFFLNAKKITKAFSVVCPDELEEELGDFLKGKVKKVRY
jgi:O-antigen ligase